MRILAIADEESKSLWDFFDRSKFEGIDLIISCGDLDPAYLSFLTTLTSIPVLYVHGNHDEKYDRIPPEGCICIDDRIYVHNGVRILGLGGSMEYSGGRYQYTEAQMRRRLTKLWVQIMMHDGFDILVTHAPAHGLNDGEDLPHRGFQVFCTMMKRYKPKYLLHGHVHLNYSRKHRRYDRYLETTVINAYEKCVFDYEDEGRIPV